MGGLETRERERATAGQLDVQPGCTHPGASSEEILTLIDCLHEDNLPVQPVAQRRGIEPLKEPLAPACGGAQNVSTRISISGLVIPDRWQGRSRERPLPGPGTSFEYGSGVSPENGARRSDYQKELA